MHHVVRHYRRISADQLPTVRTLDGTTRLATDRELLNLGIHRVAPDIYSCVEQHRRQPDGAWKQHGEPHPGEVLSEGFLPARHAKLPADVRQHVLRAHVKHQGDGVEVHEHIPMANVQSHHTVVASNLYPHRWHGEPEQ